MISGWRELLLIGLNLWGKLKQSSRIFNPSFIQITIWGSFWRLNLLCLPSRLRCKRGALDGTRPRWFLSTINRIPNLDKAEKYQQRHQMRPSERLMAFQSTHNLTTSTLSTASTTQSIHCQPQEQISRNTSNHKPKILLKLQELQQNSRKNTLTRNTT